MSEAHPEGSEGQPEGSEGQPEGCEGQPEGIKGLPKGFEGQLGGRGGGTDGWNLSTSHRTLCPIRAAAQKKSGMTYAMFLRQYLAFSDFWQKFGNFW